MSQASYGTDVFSPIRSNVSFDDRVSIGRVSDFFENPSIPFEGVGKTTNNEKKKKDLSTDEVFSRDPLPSALKADKIAEKKNKKDSSLETDLKNLCKVTTRRSKNSHKSKRELAVIPESKSILNNEAPKIRKNDNVMSKPVTDSNKEIVSNSVKQNHSSLPSVNSAALKKASLSRKPKQNKDISSSLTNLVNSNEQLPQSYQKQNEEPSPSSINLADSNKEKSPNRIKQSKDFSLSLINFSDSKKELSTHKNKVDSLLSSFKTVDSSKESISSEINVNKDSFSPDLVHLAFNLGVDTTKSDYNNPKKQSHILEVFQSSNVTLKNSSSSIQVTRDSKVPSKKFELPEVVNLDKENQSQGEVTENFLAESSYSSASSTKQMQANIEKLVKDAVSFEFDGIRQMLYLQHLQILKYIDGNLVNCQLQNIIEKLLEENRRLKNIIAGQKF